MGNEFLSQRSATEAEGEPLGAKPARSVVTSYLLTEYSTGLAPASVNMQPQLMQCLARTGLFCLSGVIVLLQDLIQDTVWHLVLLPWSTQTSESIPVSPCVCSLDRLGQYWLCV